MNSIQFFCITLCIAGCVLLVGILSYMLSISVPESPAYNPNPNHTNPKPNPTDLTNPNIWPKIYIRICTVPFTVCTGRYLYNFAFVLSLNFSTYWLSVSYIAEACSWIESGRLMSVRYLFCCGEQNCGKRYCITSFYSASSSEVSYRE